MKSIELQVVSGPFRKLWYKIKIQNKLKRKENSVQFMHSLNLLPRMKIWKTKMTLINIHVSHDILAQPVTDIVRQYRSGKND